MGDLMQQQQLIEEELIRDEGKKESAYTDSLGFITIGIGRMIDARKGGKLTDQEIMYLFRNSLTVVENFLNKNIPWWTTLSAVRQRVLINMAFNLQGNLLNFKKFLFAVQAGQYDIAAAEMEDSKWFGQVGKRAKRLQYMMLKDAVPPNTPEFF